MKLKPNSLFFTILLVASGLFISSCKAPKKTSKTKRATTTKAPDNKEKNNSKSKENEKNIVNKYAEILVVPGKIISNNISLYTFIEEWTGVPYQYGGKSKQGVDCSGFTTILYREVFNKSVVGSSNSLFTQCEPINPKELKEGDLVFFKIEQPKISHIGVYLQNNKFVHATTKRGVMINDLDEPYYKKYFYKAGRLK